MRKMFKLLALASVFALLITGCGQANPTSSASNNNSSSSDESNTANNTPSESTPDSNAGPVLSRVMQNKVIKVGFEGTYVPFNFKNDQGQFDGFDTDISNEIAKRMGVKAEFIATPWDGLIGGLKSDKFDIIIAQMSITDERKKSVDFTDPYVITGGVLITRKDTNDITKLEDLKGKNVGVGGGTTFEQLARSVEGANVHVYKSAGEYFQDLLNKRLDVIINDNQVAAWRISHDNMPLKAASGLLNQDLIGMAVKKGNEDFVQKLNQVLGEIKSDGTYDKLFVKWFGVKPLAK